MGAAGCALVVLLAAGLGAWAKLGWALQRDNAELQAALADVHEYPKRCEQVPNYKGTLLSPDNCDIPRHHKSPDILVWGDSHAAHLIPVVSRYAIRRNLSMRTRWMPVCPPWLDYSPTLVGADLIVGCQHFNRDVANEIRVLSQSGLHTVIISWLGEFYLSNPAAFSATQVGIRETIQAITDVGVRVIIVTPSPKFKKDIPACLARRKETDCDMTRSEAESGRRADLELVAEANIERKWVSILDPLPSLCTQLRCPVYDGGAVLYEDSDHLSEAGSMRLRKELERALDPSAFHPTLPRGMQSNH